MNLTLKIVLAVLAAIVLLFGASWWLNVLTAEWFTAIATVLLAAVALFTIMRDEVLRWFRHPKFEVRFEARKPDCNETVTMLTRQSETGVVTTHQIGGHYIRARIVNTGDAMAEDVEVSVIQVRRRGADGNCLVPMATPWNFVWANIGSDVLHRLHIEAERHVDLGHVFDPHYRQLAGEDLSGSDQAKTLFCLAFVTKSNTREYLLAPGEYHIDFRVYASNSRPSPVYTFYLNHTGSWFPDEDRMYTEGLGMRVGPRG